MNTHKAAAKSARSLTLDLTSDRISILCEIRSRPVPIQEAANRLGLSDYRTRRLLERVDLLRKCRAAGLRARRARPATPEQQATLAGFCVHPLPIKEAAKLLGVARFRAVELLREAGAYDACLKTGRKVAAKRIVAVRIERLADPAYKPRSWRMILDDAKARCLTCDQVASEQAVSARVVEQYCEYHGYELAETSRPTGSVRPTASARTLNYAADQALAGELALLRRIYPEHAARLGAPQ